MKTLASSPLFDRWARRRTENYVDGVYWFYLGFDFTIISTYPVCLRTTTIIAGDLVVLYKDNVDFPKRSSAICFVIRHVGLKN